MNERLVEEQEGKDRYEDGGTEVVDRKGKR